MTRARSVLRLGTRGSPLALVQAGWVRDRLLAEDPGLRVEIREIRTTGDRLRGPLHEVGGKGLFLKEIEEALLSGEVDAGVHSMKDLPATLPADLAILAVPAREDPRDALVGGELEALRRGARVGTGSLRRQALLRHLRPDLEVVGLRGNVGTRLERWRCGDLDGVVLARAGLRRLSMDLPEAVPLDPLVFVPAIGQGTLAIEARERSSWRDHLERLEDPVARVATEAERSFLATIGGDCATPIAAYAQALDGRVRIQGLVADPTGAPLVSGERQGRAGEAARLGRELAQEILGNGGREILEALGK